MAHEYIHSGSIGNNEKCIEVINETNDFLRGFYRKHVIKGFQTLLITGKEYADDSLIFSDYNSVTRGKFPFVFCAIEPLKDSRIPGESLDKIMKKRDYLRIFV